MYVPTRRLGGSQVLLRQFSEEANVFLNQIPARCQDIAKNVLCIHYYLPCGYNGTLHVPLPLCPDVCRYMSETLCPDIWSFVARFLNSSSIDPEYRNDEGVKLPVCNDTDQMINYLNLSSDCCSDGGVVLPSSTIITSTYNCNVNCFLFINRSMINNIYYLSIICVYLVVCEL